MPLLFSGSGARLPRGRQFQNLLSASIFILEAPTLTYPQLQTPQHLSKFQFLSEQSVNYVSLQVFSTSLFLVRIILNDDPWSLNALTATLRHKVILVKSLKEAG